jgi:hypothetical protein
VTRPPWTTAADGAVAAVAYLAEQEFDRRLVEPRSDDLQLLGGMVTSDPALWRPLGLMMHLGAGAAFGLGFERIAAPRLPGPYWLRGLLAAQLENALLWPLLLIVESRHPAVRTGALAPLNHPRYFLQAVARHAALGLVLGILLGGRPASPRPWRHGVPWAGYDWRDAERHRRRARRGGARPRRAPSGRPGPGGRLEARAFGSNR